MIALVAARSSGAWPTARRQARGRVRHRLALPRDGFGPPLDDGRGGCEALGWLGRIVRRAMRLPPRPRDEVAAGALCAAAAVAALLSPPVSVALLVSIPVREWWARRRRQRQRAEAMLRELPDIVDLLTLAVGSGASPRQAVEAAHRYGPGELGRAFGHTLVEVDQRGARLADALSELPDALGPLVGVVVRPLVAAERYGTSLAATLELVGRDLRDLRRRRTEESIRKVPVKLIFPLVCCTLPAFAVLTIVPLLAGSFRQLGLD